MAGKRADVMLSSTIFERVMAVKMAARSNSVGSFANSMQEFESFRDFFTSATLTTLRVHGTQVTRRPRRGPRPSRF